MPHEPFAFESQTVDGDPLPMMVAESVPNSDILGPMFLPKLAHDMLLDFVVNRPCAARALVVLGPPKSGSTTVLHEVLPRMVAAQPSDFVPVFVRVTFELDDTPERAAKRMWEALRDVARAFDASYDVDIPAKATFEVARREVPYLIERLSRSFKNNKRQLWLLLDECQV
jgi:hypothetical protein